MTAAAIALLSLVLAGKDQGKRMAGHCRAGLPVCAALLLLPGCDDKSGKVVSKPDRSALAAGGSAFVVRVDPAADGTKPNELTMVQAAEIIQKRLNPTGARTVLVTPQGDGKLMVEVAGLTAEEAEASKPAIQRLGKLEFRLLGPEGREHTTQEDTSIRPGYAKMRYLDEDWEEKEKIAAMSPAERRVRPKANKFLWVKNKAEISGKSVEFAGAQIVPGATYYHLDIQLRDEFGEKMRTISKTNMHQPMAIIVDGEVISAPTIQGEFGKNFQITGSFTETEAAELANQLMNPLENPFIVEKISAIPPSAAGQK